MPFSTWRQLGQVLAHVTSLACSGRLHIKNEDCFTLCSVCDGGQVASVSAMSNPVGTRGNVCGAGLISNLISVSTGVCVNNPDD